MRGAAPAAPLILASGRERGLVKPIHGFPVRGRKGDMGAGLRIAAAADPEKGFSVGAIAREGVLLGIEAFDAERTQRRIVEFLRPLDAVASVT